MVLCLQSKKQQLCFCQFFLPAPHAAGMRALTVENMDMSQTTRTVGGFCRTAVQSRLRQKRRGIQHHRAPSIYSRPPPPPIKTAHMAQESGFVCQKGWSSYAMQVGLYTMFSVKVPSFQGILRRTTPHFMACFGSYFLLVLGVGVVEAVFTPTCVRSANLNILTTIGDKTITYLTFFPDELF